MTAPLLIVAGAGQGLGRSVVILALKRGYRVLALSRTAAHLNSLRIDAPSPLLEVAVVDLTDGEATAAIITATAQRTPVRALVHCAATWLGGSDVIDNDIELYRQSFDANFFSALHAIKPVLANWTNCGRRDDLAIVTVGATASLRGGKRSSAFAVAKSALRTLSQSLACGSSTHTYDRRKQSPHDGVSRAGRPKKKSPSRERGA